MEKIHMEKEIWKDIEGYKGLYQVSNIGRVKRLERTVKQFVVRKICDYRYKELILSSKKDRYGYLYVHLYKDKKMKHCTVHRLVAEAFIPNDDPEHKTQVNHRDENKQNNTVWFKDDGSIDLDKTNLEWCNVIYNINYGNRTNKAMKKRRKPVKQLSLDGTLIAIWPSIKETGFKNPSNICNCCKGNIKTAYGFKWEYV